MKSKCPLMGSVLWMSVATCCAAPTQVPLGQVPGSETFVPGGQQGGAMGSEIDYSGFDSSQFTAMYFGVNPGEPSQFYQPNVNLDGVHTTLDFASTQGTTAIWQGSTVADLSGGGPMTIPLRFLMEVTGLGANPWVDPTSVSLPAAMGAAVADPAGLDFQVHFYFQADYGGGFGPLVPAPFGSQGGTVGSGIGFTFYIVRPTPEPSTFILTALGGLALLADRRGRRFATRQARQMHG